MSRGWLRHRKQGKVPLSSEYLSRRCDEARGEAIEVRSCESHRRTTVTGVRKGILFVFVRRSTRACNLTSRGRKRGRSEYRQLSDANHCGLESEKPDLQSMFKKPGGDTTEPKVWETLRGVMGERRLRSVAIGPDETAR